MSDPLFPTFHLKESEILIVLDIYNKLKNNFTAGFDFDFTFNFKEFESFDYYEINDFGPVICLNKNSQKFYIIFTEVSYKTLSGRYSYLNTDIKRGVLYF